MRTHRQLATPAAIMLGVAMRSQHQGAALARAGSGERLRQRGAVRARPLEDGHGDPRQVPAGAAGLVEMRFTAIRHSHFSLRAVRTAFIKDSSLKGLSR